MPGMLYGVTGAASDAEPSVGVAESVGVPTSELPPSVAVPASAVPLLELLLQATRHAAVAIKNEGRTGRPWFGWVSARGVLSACLGTRARLDRLASRATMGRPATGLTRTQSSGSGFLDCVLVL